MATAEKSVVYALIGNIPSNYHSSDLRNYFSQFIESGGFVCFHFRHRPEVRDAAGSVSQRASNQLRSDTCTCSHSNSDKVERKGKSMCCVVKVLPEKLDDLLKMYHRKHWLDSKGNSIACRCFISRIKVSSHSYDGKSCSISLHLVNYVWSISLSMTLSYKFVGWDCLGYFLWPIFDCLKEK